MADDSHPQPSANWVDASPGESGVTTETLPRHMKFVRVSRDELDDLKSSNSTLELAFFGICLGAFITVATTLKTVTLADSSTHAAFVASTVIFGLLTAYFFAATIRGELRWRRKIDNLKNSSAGDDATLRPR